MTQSEKTLKKTGRYADLVVLAASGLLLGLMGFFAWTTVYSSDDYWYSTFWDKGFRAYLELMVYHYQEFNGRVLVHVLAHIVLELGQWAFVLMCCGLSVAACLAAVRGAGLEKDKLPVMLCLFLTGMLCMPLSIFNQGVMWISASCNYLFPAVLVCLMATSLERRSGWCFLLAFLCGATTEQMGLAAVVLALAYALDRAIRREGFVHGIGSTALALAGVVSIFLSPATASRTDRRVHMDSLEVVLETFRKAILREAELLTLNPAPVVVMLAILALGGLVLLRGKGWKWPAVLGGIGCAGLIVGSFGAEWIRLAGYVLGFAALAGMSVALMAGGERFAGGLTLTGLAAAAVMLPTNTVEPRVMLPVYLLLLVSACVLVVRLLRSSAAVAAAGVILAFAVSVPAIGGYWHNYQIDLENKGYAQTDRDQEAIRYCTDYDMDYTWVKAYSDPYFRMKYMESIGLPEYTPARFFSWNDIAAQIQCGDQILFRPPWLWEDGTVMFPLRETVEALGGSLEWTVERRAVTLDGVSLELEPIDGSLFLARTADGEKEFQVSWELKGGDTYCDLALFEDGFGLTIRENPDKHLYIIDK